MVVFIHVHIVTIKLERERENQKTVRQRPTHHNKGEKAEIFSQSVEIQKQCNTAA